MKFRHDPLYPSRRSPVFGDNLVSTSHPLAAQAGITVLRDGGNAVDAAIAAAAVLTVVEPTGNGLGSDAFCILWDGKTLHGLNASGAAPAGWTPERFSGADKMPFRGWESVTVPGAVSAWCALRDKFGTRALTSLLEPAARYAEDGFIVTPIIGELWRRGGETLRDQPGFGDAFLPGGQAPRPGERFRNPSQARSLRAIAETNGRTFYEGDLAEKIAAFAAEHGAVLSLEDLATHQPEWCGTLSTGFDDTDLHEIPPNGQGIAALMALGILEHTPVREYGPDDVAAIHLQIEAIKLAFADLEAYVADGRHMIGPTAEDLLDPDYLKRRAAEIAPNKAAAYQAGAPKAGGTVYLTVADASGMMVSYIQSNYAGFGSGVVVPGTGISLQNRGAGFTLAPDHQNLVAPGKRPFHTIIPGFAMRHGAPEMSFGVMGGPMQAQGHVQMMLRTQLWGQDVQTAADAPRWRFVEGRQVACEDTIPAETLATLAALGHDINVEAPDSAFGFGGAQLIRKLDGGGYVAGSDPRKDGQAIAF
ncbi:gamma-glutamyltransferase family protein [Salibaculum sp.]|jgi:gamma-glutamyltranspeptidase/glutathione hydrolase|uniref:gamma-glutamyltransferase family protein n=1 Tax=Roseovarius halophilus (ex Wu et al. 2025) TaxID=3376060 RepID=UPI00287028F6|nr:gamma-glutamyltransferase family protein [Salibaculum sp.]MDR9428982.1 gamma-glutamyltransferase family protein [Salibaculum sp.]